MRKTILLAGLALMLAAGTASAQTSVRLSLGFGVPRPYVSGYVFVGRPHLRPVYRPYLYRPDFHRRHLHRRLVVVRVPPRRVIVVEPRFHRFRRDGGYGYGQHRDHDRE
jgi:hypothetical protein